MGFGLAQLWRTPSSVSGAETGFPLTGGGADSILLLGNSCHHGNREPGPLCEHRKGSSFSGGIKRNLIIEHSPLPAGLNGTGGHRVSGLHYYPI